MITPESNSLTSTYEQVTGINTKRWFPLVRQLSTGVSSSGWVEQAKVLADLEKIRRSTRSHLESRAKSKLNAPFVLINGLGYVEVPANVAAQLTEPGVNLGTPLAGIAYEAFRYIEVNYGLQKTDRINVQWVGTAEEALQAIKAKDAKTPKTP